MRKYEIMFIVRPTSSEEETEKTVATFENVITSNGAKLIDKQDLGQKELAYEIKKFKSGHYYLFTVEANDDKAIKEFDRLGLISGDIVRHLITKIED